MLWRTALEHRAQVVEVFTARRPAPNWAQDGSDQVSSRPVLHRWFNTSTTLQLRLQHWNNTVQHCSTLCNTVQHCSTLCNTSTLWLRFRLVLTILSCHINQVCILVGETDIRDRHFFWKQASIEKWIGVTHTKLTLAYSPTKSPTNTVWCLQSFPGETANPGIGPRHWVRVLTSTV